MKLKHDKLLSNVAFNCNLRHYTKAGTVEAARCEQALEWCGHLAAGLAKGGEAASNAMARLEAMCAAAAGAGGKAA